MDRREIPLSGDFPGLATNSTTSPFLMTLVQSHPQKIACVAVPADFGLPSTDITLESEGLKLSGWHIPASSPERPVVVICHGLGANKQK
jgi:hypothetical protein